jgi:hypothetical protein
MGTGFALTIAWSHALREFRKHCKISYLWAYESRCSYSIRRRGRLFSGVFRFEGASGSSIFYFNSPSLRACSAHKNRFRYGSRRELQSPQRLSQSGRRKSHKQSLITLMGRVLLALDRTSKMNSARQLCSASSVSSVLIMRARCSFFIACAGRMRRASKTTNKAPSPQMNSCCRSSLAADG